MKPVLIRSDAASDIEDAFAWYETERAGLGGEFREVLRDTLGMIAAHPRSFPIILRGTRRALLKRFPYSVYFRELSDAIVVVACLHGHRDPRRWRSRV